MVKSRHAPDETAFHFRQDRAHALLLLVQGQKLLFYRIAQVAEVRSAQRPAHGNEHVRAGLGQHPFIHSHQNFPIRFCLVNQNARHQRRHTIESVRQESERAVARLRDDAIRG